MLLKYGRYYIRVHPCPLIHVSLQIHECKDPQSQNSAAIEPAQQSQQPTTNENAHDSPVSDRHTKYWNYNNNSTSSDTKPWNYLELLVNIDSVVEEVAVADDHGSPGTLFVKYDNETVYQSGSRDSTDKIQDSTSDISYVRQLKINDIIEVTYPDHSQLTVKLLSRAGKVGTSNLGKYRNE